MLNIVGGIIRAVVPPVLTYLIAKGTIPAGDYSAVVTALMALVTAVWSVKTNIK